MGFSRTPPRPKNAAEFVAGAETVPTRSRAKHEHDTNVIPSQAVRIAKQTIQRVSEKPWAGLDPKATARQAFNLRLNDYERALLKYVADQDEDLSMHKIVKRILIPELERRVGLDKN